MLECCEKPDPVLLESTFTKTYGHKAQDAFHGIERCSKPEDGLWTSGTIFLHVFLYNGYHSVCEISSSGTLEREKGGW